MCKGNRQRHQLRRLAAGITEHHALVACPVLKLSILSLFALQCLIHSKSNICRLLIDIDNYAAGFAVKAILCTVISDLPDYTAGDAGDVYIRFGRDFSHDMNQPC